jgi:hypothetical protein
MMLHAQKKDVMQEKLYVQEEQGFESIYYKG